MAKGILKPPKPSVEKRNRRQHTEETEQQDDFFSVLCSTKALIPIACLIIAFCFAYKGYLETRINTPFGKARVVQKSGLNVPDRFWGSYRPNVYFGMKTRDPYSLVTGIMWYYPSRVSYLSDVRHWCEQGDARRAYTWTAHDGHSFGIQRIADDDFSIVTSFVKKIKGAFGGDWTARVSFQCDGCDDYVSVLFYAAIENQTVGSIHKDDLFVTGYTDSLGGFKIRLNNVKGVISHQSIMEAYCQGLDVIKETTLGSLYLADEAKRFYGLNSPVSKESPNLVVTQLTLKAPFDIDIIYESENAERSVTFSEDIYTDELRKLEVEFDDKFESVFRLAKKGFGAEEIAFAKAAFSNLIGGIGYFYGASRVLSEHTDAPVPYWKAPLYTAVPSRSFFPRGFLWDEGFHGLLLAVWDLDIEFDIIGHWFDLMNVEGWIPREQILGAEALKRVPTEFVTQLNTNANPPAFFLTLSFIVRNLEDKVLLQPTRLETLDRLYQRLVAWFDWFNTTQTGPLPGTYRWRGRDANSTYELNPKTLTSGLDDYPRASHPTEDERHLDLRCWIAYAASAMVTISSAVSRPPGRFAETVAYLTENSLLDRYHWSEAEQLYADYGLHTDDVALRRPQDGGKLVRVVRSKPVMRYVDKTFGYNSLYPLLLNIIDPQNPRLGIVLEKLRDTNLLWTEYGLRSLSKSSPLYGARNTEDDPPYWRGSIWLNINYLAIRSLKYYSTRLGPYSKVAGALYEELRRNVIANVFKEYKRTGYLWERYNDVTGEGEGARPFSGWTSLVVLIMSENY